MEQKLFTEKTVRGLCLNIASLSLPEDYRSDEQVKAESDRIYNFTAETEPASPVGYTEEQVREAHNHAFGILDSDFGLSERKTEYDLHLNLLKQRLLVSAPKQEAEKNHYNLADSVCWNLDDVPASHPKEEAEPSGEWWCATCQTSPLPENVTFEERHDKCGCLVTVAPLAAPTVEPPTYREALIETVKTIESWEDTAIGHLMKGEQTLPAQTFQKWFAIHIQKIHAALSSSVLAPQSVGSEQADARTKMYAAYSESVDLADAVKWILNGPTEDLVKTSLLYAFATGQHKYEQCLATVSAPTGELVEALRGIISRMEYRRDQLFSFAKDGRLNGYNNSADKQQAVAEHFDMVISDLSATLANYNQSTNPDKK